MWCDDGDGGFPPQYQAKRDGFDHYTILNLTVLPILQRFHELLTDLYHTKTGRNTANVQLNTSHLIGVSDISHICFFHDVTVIVVVFLSGLRTRVEVALDIQTPIPADVKRGDLTRTAH